MQLRLPPLTKHQFTTSPSPCSPTRGLLLEGKQEERTGGWVERDWVEGKQEELLLTEGEWVKGKQEERWIKGAPGVKLHPKAVHVPCDDLELLTRCG